MNESFPAASEIVEGEVVHTDDKVRALNLHNYIVCDSIIVKEKIFQICINLSIIRDDHLYTLLGYTSFKDYCFHALNYSFSTAKEYRVVGSFLRTVREGHASGYELDNYDLDDLGVKKLYMIAKMPSGEFQRLRDSLDSPDDIYSLSIRDLRHKLNDLRSGVAKESMKEPRKQLDPPSSPSSPSSAAPDPIESQWISLCMQLRSLVDQMDSFVFSHSSVVMDCEVKHYFNRVRVALDHDLEGFGG